MKPFMDEDFLLTTGAARALYREAAEKMPIYDYHCHLNPKEIADNIAFRNIGHLMLGGDHYKWRAMAAAGYDNQFIRAGDDKQRFFAYAKAMPRMIGNPLYHWTHLELKRVFGIAEPLNEGSAPRIWDEANEKLVSDEFRAQRLIEKFDVRLVCTTDDPADDLAEHARIGAQKGFSTKVLPAFRPDKAIHLERAGFPEYIGRLGRAAGVEIDSAEDVIRALEARVQYFHERGARVSDHGLDSVPFCGGAPELMERAFQCAMRGEAPSAEGAEQYKTALLVRLGAMYARRGWVQQYHMNALRNNNARMFRSFGPDTGFDSVADHPLAVKLARLMDAQERDGLLPKTILYTLNPADNYVLASMAGNFQGGTPGKIQFGSGWWFCDQRDGMVEQLKALAGLGLLAPFVGMLTDSRSFVSYPRHEYFRRILCELVGGWVENGEYPADWDMLYEIIGGICYDNAAAYFGIEI